MFRDARPCFVLPELFSTTRPAVPRFHEASKTRRHPLQGCSVRRSSLTPKWGRASSLSRSHNNEMEPQAQQAYGVRCLVSALKAATSRRTPKEYGDIYAT